MALFVMWDLASLELEDYKNNEIAKTLWWKPSTNRDSIVDNAAHLQGFGFGFVVGTVFHSEISIDQRKSLTEAIMITHSIESTRYDDLVQQQLRCFGIRSDDVLQCQLMNAHVHENFTAFLVNHHRPRFDLHLALGSDEDMEEARSRVVDLQNNPNIRCLTTTANSLEQLKFWGLLGFEVINKDNDGEVLLWSKPKNKQD